MIRTIDYSHKLFENIEKTNFSVNISRQIKGLKHWF